MSTVRRITPMLFTKDIRATADFYTTYLHFELAGIDKTMCQLVSGYAQFMFYSSTDIDAKPTLTGQIYCYPHDLDEYWGELKDHENIVSPLTVQPWGMREFRIRDPNGYTLVFGLSADPDHGHGDDHSHDH